MSLTFNSFLFNINLSNRRIGTLLCNFLLSTTCRTEHFQEYFTSVWKQIQTFSQQFDVEQFWTNQDALCTKTSIKISKFPLHHSVIFAVWSEVSAAFRWGVCELQACRVSRSSSFTQEKDVAAAWGRDEEEFTPGPLWSRCLSGQSAPRGSWGCDWQLNRTESSAGKLGLIVFFKKRLWTEEMKSCCSLNDPVSAGLFCGWSPEQRLFDHFFFCCFWKTVQPNGFSLNE